MRITHRHICFVCAQNWNTTQQIRLHMRARAHSCSFSHYTRLLVLTLHSTQFNSTLCNNRLWWKKADLARITLPYNWFSWLNFTAQQVEMNATNTHTEIHSRAHSVVANVRTLCERTVCVVRIRADATTSRHENRTEAHKKELLLAVRNLCDFNTICARSFLWLCVIFANAVSAKPEAIELVSSQQTAIESFVCLFASFALRSCE